MLLFAKTESDYESPADTIDSFVRAICDSANLPTYADVSDQLAVEDTNPYYESWLMESRPCKWFGRPPFSTEKQF